MGNQGIRSRQRGSVGAPELGDGGEIGGSVFEAALDCIFTMDSGGLVLDINPAAERTFGYAREEIRGQRLADLIIPDDFHAAHERALRRYVETGRPTILDQRLELTAKTAEGRLMPVELTVTRLGRSEPPVFAGFIRDLTERHRADERIAELLAREQAARLEAEAAERAARRVSEALQRSLLPPHLPDISGIELAAAYQPSDERSIVGGDFYDVFPISGERWGIVMGDVSGKGPDAASLTGLVRYTLRTAGAGERRADAVLSIVNDALVREREDNAYCTLAYANLSIGGGRPRLELSIAGHPLPLLLQGDGRVDTLGRPGPILGATTTPSFAIDEIELGEDHTVLLYTDGVTDTRTPNGFFGTAGLRRLLQDCPRRTPEELVACVAAGVHDGPGHRVTDDLALMAIRPRATVA